MLLYKCLNLMFQALSQMSVNVSLCSKCAHSNDCLALFIVSLSLPIMIPCLRRRCLRLCPSILNWYASSPENALLPHSNAEQSPRVISIRRIKVSKLFARCSHALIQSIKKTTKLVPRHPKALSKVRSSLISRPSKSNGDRLRGA